MGSVGEKLESLLIKFPGTIGGILALAFIGSITKPARDELKHDYLMERALKIADSKGNKDNFVSPDEERSIYNELGIPMMGYAGWPSDHRKLSFTELKKYITKNQLEYLPKDKEKSKLQLLLGR